MQLFPLSFSCYFMFADVAATLSNVHKAAKYTALERCGKIGNFQ